MGKTRMTEEEYQSLLRRRERKSERELKTGYDAVTEKQFQDQLRQAALWHQWFFYHTYDSRKSDEHFPDSILLRPPRWIIAELKIEGENATPGQLWWLEQFKRCGAEVHVWKPSDIDEILNALR